MILAAIAGTFPICCGFATGDEQLYMLGRNLNGNAASRRYFCGDPVGMSQCDCGSNSGRPRAAVEIWIPGRLLLSAFANYKSTRETIGPAIIAGKRGPRCDRPRG